MDLPGGHHHISHDVVEPLDLERVADVPGLIPVHAVVILAAEVDEAAVNANVLARRLAQKTRCWHRWAQNDQS